MGNKPLNEDEPLHFGHVLSVFFFYCVWTYQSGQVPEEYGFYLTAVYYTGAVGPVVLLSCLFGFALWLPVWLLYCFFAETFNPPRLASFVLPISVLACGALVVGYYFPKYYLG